MKNIILILVISLLSLPGISQTVWYPQTSGTNSYLFDIHFTDPYHGWLCGNTGLIMSTTDGGATWIELDAPPVNTYYGIHFTDNQHGWAVGYGGQISYTSDGGSIWTEQTGISNTYLYDLHFIDENTGWIVGGDNGTFPSLTPYREIMYTSDGGNTWVAQVSQSHEKPLRCVHFSDATTGYAAGEAGTVMRTVDGGSNWTEVMYDQPYEFSGIHSVNPSTAFVTGTYLGLPHVSVIFKTMDGGTTWTSQTFGQDESLVDICFPDENNGWAVGGKNNSGTILRTTDGGSTWFNEDPGTDNFLSAVCFIDTTTGWAVGPNGTVIATQLFTGIDDPVSSINLTVYPNPATDRLNIQLEADQGEAFSIQLVNTMGQSVFSQEGSTLSGSETLRINTTGFPQGIYTIILETAKDRQTRKVMIR